VIWRLIPYHIKLLVVMYHELGHVMALVLAGKRVQTVNIDPVGGPFFRISAFRPSKNLTGDFYPERRRFYTDRALNGSCPPLLQ
jgi:hypothetical protein